MNKTRWGVFLGSCVMAVSLFLLTPVKGYSLSFGEALYSDPRYFESYIQYGNFISYSLPVLALIYGGQNTPFDIPGSPGQISDDIVIMTGTNNANVNSNPDGMDNPYKTPSTNASSTFSTHLAADPDPSGPFAGDQPFTWDISIAALTQYLDGLDMFFFFNHNETNSGDSQDLRIWTQLAIRDSTGQTEALYFDLRSMGPDGSGIFQGDPLTFSSPGLLSGGELGDGSASPGPSQADFVLSPGQVCLDANFSPTACTSGTTTVNHNLGVNEVAYAVTAPAVNLFLRNWTADSVYDVISMDIRMYDISNGYEQAFIRGVQTSSTVTPDPIPEPSTILLLGAGMVGLALFGRKRMHKE
ncbi:MAG: PEP-CTERM sorting domain-containing protein [Desulfovibrionales bacterium]|nr:MAG: PEP-CTERM sorting domain-containing protein [Desulfovibrionales bacterium]